MYSVCERAHKDVSRCRFLFSEKKNCVLFMRLYVCLYARPVSKRRL